MGQFDEGRCFGINLKNGLTYVFCCSDNKLNIKLEDNV